MKSLKKLVSLESRTWFAGILNVFVLLLQAVKLLEVKDSTAISIPMFLGFCYIQVTLAQAGYRKKDWGQFWGMAVSTAASTLIIILAVIYR